ncbi:MAG: elongation factor P [Thermoanaerobaculia bacterium]|nr:elongation factor P [Thermoanaerobaculia bacterium]
MGSIDANAARSGTKLLLDGDPYTVLERAHHKPGKGGAFVRFKLKGIVSGKVIDHTVRAGTKMETADVSVKTMQYLYQQAEDYVFMDLQTYDQIHIPGDLLGDDAGFLIETAEVEVTLFEGTPVGVQLPQKMVFEVVETIDNPNMGNTATNVTKDATIETGKVVQVPPFIKTGDKIRVLTENGSYLERA